MKQPKFLKYCIYHKDGEEVNASGGGAIEMDSSPIENRAPDSGAPEIVKNDVQGDLRSDRHEDLKSLFEDPKNIKKDVIEKDIEVKPEPKRQEQVVNQKDEAKDILDTIDVPKNASPKTVDSWNKLKSHTREMVQTIARTKDEEISKLQAALSEYTGKSKSEVEKLMRENDDLKGYRFAFDAYSDPDFQDKYIKPVENAKKDIIDTLKRIGANDQEIGMIDFSNPKHLKTVRDLIKEKDEVQGEIFKEKEKELLKLNNSLSTAFEDSRKRYKEILDERGKQQITKKAESETKIRSTIQAIASLKNEDKTPKFSFLSKLQASNPNDPAESDRVQKHNQQVEKAYKNIELLSKEESSEERTKIAAAAVLATIQAQEIASLKDELQKVKSNLSKVVKADNTAKSSTAGENVSPQRNGLDRRSLKEALNDEFPEFARD
jgi:hypothetical protein